MALSFGDVLRGVGDVAYDWSVACNIMSGVRGMQDGVGLNDIGNIALGLGQAGLFFIPGGGGALAAGKIAAQGAKAAGKGILKSQGSRIGGIVKGLNPKSYASGAVQNIKGAGASGLLKRGAIGTATGAALTGAANAIMPAASATPTTNTRQAPSLDAIMRSWQQTQQAAALMGTNAPATTPDLSGVSLDSGDSAYSAATGQARSQYKSELDAAKRALSTQLMGVGQWQSGFGQDMAMAAAEAGMDTSPGALDVGLDSVAQAAALEQLKARGQFAKAKGEAEAQLRQRQSAAALERQQRQQQAALEQMKLLYGLA